MYSIFIAHFMQCDFTQPDKQIVPAGNFGVIIRC